MSNRPRYSPWLRVEEVAAAMRIPATLLSVMASRGDVPTVKFGGRRLFHYRELPPSKAMARLHPKDPAPAVTDIDGAAAWLRVAPMTFRRTLWRAPLPAVKLGKAWQVDLPALEQLLLSVRDV